MLAEAENVALFKGNTQVSVSNGQGRESMKTDLSDTAVCLHLHESDVRASILSVSAVRLRFACVCVGVMHASV